jgi:hypothetical protein
MHGPINIRFFINYLKGTSFAGTFSAKYV